MKNDPSKMRESFLVAAEKFLECGLPNKAFVCLQNSREKELVAHLYEKTNQLERAVETYHKLKRPLEASRCYEQLGKFNLAVETLVENGLYEMAIDTLKRYKNLKENLEKAGSPVPQILVANAPSQHHTVESLSFKSAIDYHKSNKKEKMMAALARLPKLEEKTEFLMRRNYIEEAANLLQESEKFQEAVDLYSKAGMSKDALLCSQKLNDKDAIGQSLILDSKIRLSQYDDFGKIEDEVKNEICENLDQAFFTLQDLDNTLGAGEAALLRGELTGERDFINKAFCAFLKSKPYKSEIGQLECMHWIVHNSDITNTKNLSQCIIGMQNLFGILSVLTKPVNEQERTRLHEVLKFFGFYPELLENKVVYYPKQKPRALTEWPKRRKRDFMCEEDKILVRKDIFKLLVKRGKNWKEILDKTIAAGRNRNRQCPLFKLGEPCKSKDQTADDDAHSCPFLHASLIPKTFDLLIDYDILAVELEHCVYQGAEDVKARVEDTDFELSAFKPKKHEERYKACNWLLEDLIPKCYHNASISSDHEKVKSLLRKVRYPKSPHILRKRMIMYLKCLYDDMKNKERKDNIKVFATIYLVNNLLNLGMKPKPNEIMRQTENVMNKECPKTHIKRTIEWANNRGLMIDYNDRIVYVKSFAKCLCDSFDEIMGTDNNSSEALIKFTNFCVFLSNNGSVDVLPHYNQFLLLMEYYTTLAFCLCAKVQITPNFFFVVPESFISVVYFIDATFVQEHGVSTFEAIQRLKIKRPVEDIIFFHNHLEKMINIVCGFKSKINLILQIFQSLNPETPDADEAYGIAERLVILALVFICNLERGVNAELETKLMRELCKLEVREGYPARLSNALKQVQQADSPADVAEALQTLLAKREGDSLQYCIWNNYNKRNGLQMQQLKITEVSKRFFKEEKTFKATNSSHDFEQSKSRTEEEMTIDQRLDRNKEDKEKRVKEEDTDKNITVNLRLKTKNVSKPVVIHLKQEKLDEKMKELESVQMTNAKCGVCGVVFRKMANYPTVITDPVTSSQRQPLNESECSGIFQRSIPFTSPQPEFDSEKQNPDSLRDNPLSQQFENAKNVLPETATRDWNRETRKEHEQNPKHKQKITLFQLFKHKYDREIFDNLEKVRSFIYKHKLETNVVEIHFKDEDYNIYNLLREFKGVESKLSTIIRTCDWENAEIKNEVDTMFSSYHIIKRYVEEKAKEIKERSDKQPEAAQVEEIVDDVENDELHIERVVEEPKEKRPKGRGKRKSQRR